MKSRGFRWWLYEHILPWSSIILLGVVVWYIITQVSK